MSVEHKCYVCERVATGFTMSFFSAVNAWLCLECQARGLVWAANRALAAEKTYGSPCGRTLASAEEAEKCEACTPGFPCVLAKGHLGKHSAGPGGYEWTEGCVYMKEHNGRYLICEGISGHGDCHRNGDITWLGTDLRCDKPIPADNPFYR